MKFGIVTPSFNQAHFIRRTLESVLTQEADIDYLVIDAESTDGTIEILEDYKKRYRNFDFVSEPDDGQSDAINKGLRRVRGDILAYINADDEYAPGALRQVADFFDRHTETDWAYGEYQIIDEKNRIIRKFLSTYKHFVGRHYAYKKLLRINIVPQPSTFWRRSIVDTFGYFSTDHDLVMDYEYWCRIGERFPAKQMPFLTSLYRFYRESKSGAQYPKQYRQELEVAQAYNKGRFPFAHTLHVINYHLIVNVFRLLDRLGK